MRFTSLSLVATASLSPAVLAADDSEACATGLHMIVARGSSEAPGLGRIGVVAGNVTELIPGSTVAAVDYPATFDDYFDSEGAGAVAFVTMIAEYKKKCANAKIALLGYSQGAQALMDALCGTSETGFKVTEDLDESFDKEIIAAVTFGDPSHTVGAPWNVGTSNHTGLFARKNFESCEPFTDSIRGWCDAGDVYCDSGDDRKVHGSYFANYTMDATNFIVQKYKDSLAQSESSTSVAAPTQTPTQAPTQAPTETPTEAPTQAPTPTPSSGPVPGAAAGGAGYHGLSMLAGLLVAGYFALPQL